MLKNRFLSFFTVLVLTLSLVIATLATAEAAITPSVAASDLATAIAADPSQVTGASFVTRPPAGIPTAVSDTPLTGFPTNGSTYAILSTGDATIAANPNTSTGSSSNNGGGHVRGNSDYDVVILKIDLTAPAGTVCLGIDFRFLSEEYPEYVGKAFNDAFIAELDNSNWTTSGSNIMAPNNFAFDQNGNVVSVNSAGAATVNAANASGTTYDGATAKLTATTPVSPGAHSLYLSLFDQGDAVVDSVVFLDNLVFSNVACQKGIGGGTPLVTKPAAHPADLVGQLRVTPDRQFNLNGGFNNLLTYSLTVKNLGQGAASFVSVNLPIDPNLVVGFATIDPAETGVWVQSYVTDGDRPNMQIGFPKMEANTQHSLSVSVRAKTGATVGSSVFTRFTVSWDDDTGNGRHSLSNGVRFTLSSDTNRNDSDGAIQLFGFTAGSNNSFLLGSDFFIPDEHVDFWYTDDNSTDENKKSVALGQGQVDSNGNLVVNVSLAPFEVGKTYTIAGYGNRSNITGAGLIRVVASTSGVDGGKTFEVEPLKDFSTKLSSQNWSRIFQGR